MADGTPELTGSGISALPGEKKIAPGAAVRPREYDRAAVDSFVHSMHAKLRMNAHKGTWDDCDPFALLDRLLHEIKIELFHAMHNEDASAIRAEAADAGNFAMMIHSLADRIVELRAIP